MAIKSAVFVKGLNGTDPILEDGRPQIAFIGRSNVGKSSVINSLTGQKDLVYSSSKPGRTQEINFFLIDNRYYFVDLPGYGYARLSPKERDHLAKLVIWYFNFPVAQRTVVVLIDSKVGPTALDLEVLELLQGHGHKILVVANKIDKVTKGERARRIKEMGDQLGVEVVPYSAETHEGREQLLKLLLP